MLMWFVANWDTMEPYQPLEVQHLDEEQARYGWIGCSVEDLRNQSHNARTQDGEAIAVGITMTLVWCATRLKVNSMIRALLS